MIISRAPKVFARLLFLFLLLDVCVCVCVCVCVFLRMETPVLHAYFVWQQVEYRPTVKINKNMDTTVWATTLDKTKNLTHFMA